MKYIVSLFLSLAFILSTQAQDARSILDKANAAFIAAGGINATFTLNTEDVANKTTYSQDGTSLLKGNKFKIEVPDGITWFDGKTQWTYGKGSDEVNVSSPTGEELAGISPSILLNIYKSGFKLKNLGEQRDGTKTVYQIEMIPESKKTDFKKMIINIDKTTYLFTSIKIFGKDGFNNQLIIRKMQAGVNLPDNTFVFNKKSYPNAEIVDLR